jgi:hypothetical protein
MNLLATIDGKEVENVVDKNMFYYFPKLTIPEGQPTKFKINLEGLLGSNEYSFGIAEWGDQNEKVEDHISDLRGDYPKTNMDKIKLKNPFLTINKCDETPCKTTLTWNNPKVGKYSYFDWNEFSTEWSDEGLPLGVIIVSNSNILILKETTYDVKFTAFLNGEDVGFRSVISQKENTGSWSFPTLTIPEGQKTRFDFSKNTTTFKIKNNLGNEVKTVSCANPPCNIFWDNPEVGEYSYHHSSDSSNSGTIIVKALAQTTQATTQTTQTLAQATTQATTQTLAQTLAQTTQTLAQKTAATTNPKLSKSNKPNCTKKYCVKNKDMCNRTCWEKILFNKLSDKTIETNKMFLIKHLVDETYLFYDKGDYGYRKLESNNKIFKFQLIDNTNTITNDYNISPIDSNDNVLLTLSQHGGKGFRVTFENPHDTDIGNQLFTK